jgi:hypothetical protein
MRRAMLQIEGEFPQILPIRESLIKYVFEPAAEKVTAPLSLPFSSVIGPGRARHVHR